MAAAQSRNLRVVSGAYKATPVRNLETETFVPPIDIYLDRRLADFERRLVATGMAQRVRDAQATIANSLRRRRPLGTRGRPRGYASITEQRQDGEHTATWQEWWTTGVKNTDDALTRAWRQCWERSEATARAQRAHCGIEAADRGPTFSNRVLEKHRDLIKHQSSLLTQVRTGKIGLNAFLFDCKKPGVATPRCSCGEARETPLHLARECQEFTQQRRDLLGDIAPMALRTGRDFAAITADKEASQWLVKWLLRTGKFPQFRLAERLGRGDIPDRSHLGDAGPTEGWPDRKHG